MIACIAVAPACPAREDALCEACLESSGCPFGLDCVGGWCVSAAERCGVDRGGVTVTSPSEDDQLIDPITVVASATESFSINQLQVWDNGTKLGWYPGSSIRESYTLDAGQHEMTVEDMDDSFRVVHRTWVHFQILGSSGVQVTVPANDADVSSPVRIVASATAGVSINQIQVWEGAAKLGWYPGTRIDVKFPLDAGQHTITVEDMDQRFRVIDRTNIRFTVR
jgi:hypothetical protein